jgi:hypothetical protein
VYISNTPPKYNKKAWVEQPGWENALTAQIDPLTSRVDLKRFTRITSQSQVSQMILEAPDRIERRALVDALRGNK